MTYEHLLGLTNVVKSVVTTENSALALKSGSLKVFATPAMIRLIEQSAAELPYAMGIIDVDIDA